MGDMEGLISATIGRRGDDHCRLDPTSSYQSDVPGFLDVGYWTDRSRPDMALAHSS